MEIRKPILKIFFISLLLLVLTLVLLEPRIVGLCEGQSRYCLDPYDDAIGQPISTFAVVLIALSLILLVVPKTFSSWLRFAKYYLPIAALLIILSPVSDGSIFGFDKEFMSWLLSGAFFGISLILIIYKWFRGTRK